jgi:hypothetical protein
MSSSLHRTVIMAVPDVAASQSLQLVDELIADLV